MELRVTLYFVLLFHFLHRDYSLGFDLFMTMETCAYPAL